MDFTSPFAFVCYGVAAVALAAINFGPWIISSIGKIRFPTSVTSTPAAADEDALDLAAFNRLTARYKRLGCKEGIEAMAAAGKHFLHTE